MYCNFTKLSSIYFLKTFTKIYAEEPLVIYVVFFICMGHMCNLLLEEMLTAEWSDIQAKAEPQDSGSDRQIERKEVEVWMC